MNKSFIASSLLFLMVSSCSKEDNNYRYQAAYAIVNATTDVSSAKGYMADHEIPWKTLPTSDAVAQYRSVNFSVWAGNNIVRTVKGADTTQVLYSSAKTENLEPTTLTTLFLYGNATAGYGGLYFGNEVKENYTDSVIGIRFINLSPNSTPFSVALSNSGGSIEANALGYKQQSDFKVYPSRQSTDSIRFILKNTITGDSLTKYVLPTIPIFPYSTVGIAHSRFRNITLVIKGLQGTSSGTNALGIFPVPHY